MGIKDEAIKNAKELFPEAISDVEAVKKYAQKTFTEIRSIDEKHPKFQALKTLYMNLIGLKNELHKKNLEEMSLMIWVN